VARNDDGVCAAAVYFHDTDALYGRYWGATQFIDSLHFEACYYQGIEFCIANGLSSFDPGTQGEHKLIRGFAPTRTWSWHWFSDSRFADAIQRYLDRERVQIDHYISMASEYLPFRRDSDDRQDKTT
jgi:predicted N-acyltransferase